MGTLLKFYFSWALSSWGDRLWYFALSMYFIVLNDQTLLLTALNGFFCNFVSIFLGSYIGNIIDKHQRINVVRITLAVQNITVGLACLLVVLLLSFKEYSEKAWDGYFYYIVQGCIIVLNMIGNLASMASKVSIERDWVVVIAKHLFEKNAKSECDKNAESNGKFKEKLAQINANIRRINLISGIVGPLFAGIVMSVFNKPNSFKGSIISAICFAAWNFVSCFVEYFLLRSIYNDVPQLKKFVKKLENRSSNPFVKFSKGWSIYMKQGIFVLPGIGFSLLFLTVLGFDSVTLGYAKSQQLTEMFIGIFQGLGSISGILGTITFQTLHNKLKISLPYLSVIGSFYQTTFLFACLSSIWLPGSPFLLGEKYLSNVSHSQLNNTCYENQTSFEKLLFESPCHVYTSITVLLGGMAMSRLGLWLTDLVTNQIMQENIDEKERGVVGAVQSSLNQIFDLIKFTLVILFSDTYYYGFLVILSVAATFVSLCLYSTYAFKVEFKKKYNQVPLSEAGPFRKSMIMIVDKNQGDVDSFASFDETNNELVTST